MALWLSSGDATAMKVVTAMAASFALLSYAAYCILHMRHVVPLGLDAPLDRFSEARALQHLRRLTVDITGRQEGQPGLEEAASYIKGQLEALADRAGPDIRVEVEEAFANGSFNMIHLHHSLSLSYKNHKNVIARLSSKTSTGNSPSVLVNGHFDGPLGSPGAGDCGSCVASMLEMARVVVDSNWIPPYPIIFLFNGAEELFLLGSHGFVTTHRWSKSIAAFINIEASGTGGLDLVCRSGPGPWPSLIYAKSAKYPMAISAAQDMFGVIPGDTDYRIFAEDYGHIPGLDIIFVLGGYFYHTSYDTMENLLPGSIQARGDNLLRLLEAFTNSSLLLTSKQRSVDVASNGMKNERSVYYDYMSFFMVNYSRKESSIIHSLPLVLFIIFPLFCYSNTALSTSFAILLALSKGVLFHAWSVLLGVIVPILFATVRLAFSSTAMCWFAHPILAYLMFVPCSIVGFLIPQKFLYSFLVLDDPLAKMSDEALFDEVQFWGSFGFYGFLTMAFLVVEFSGGFLTLMISFSMFLAWFGFHLTSKFFGHRSFRSLAGYIIPLIPCLAYLVYLGGFIIQFAIEKMGMMGSLPHLYGFFLPDIIVAALIGMVTGWCMSTLLPLVGHCLVRRASMLYSFVQISVLALAISSQFFPYDAAAPKRVVLQHTFLTTDASHIAESSYDFSVVDANNLKFLFKNAPEVSEMLLINSDFYPEKIGQSARYSWLAVYPLSYLFSGSMKFPAPADEIFMHYKCMPSIHVLEVFKYENAHRRVRLELSLGSLQEIWGTVLNITGPLSNWSFADNKLPAPDIVGHTTSYISRLSGCTHENWTFWLEANSSDPLRVDVAVLDQYLLEETKKLKGLFPIWADVTAFSSFFSTYYF